MCGRYALYGPVSRHRAALRDAELPDWWTSIVDAINARPPRRNVAPTDSVPVVGLSREGEPFVHALRWGLVPYWAKDLKIGVKAINARAESISEKPMFREAFKRRRCLVPASGYYEWKGEGRAKQPYFIHDAEESLMLFAGLWETWRPEKDADAVYTFTIITGPPGIVSGSIHDRAPVILREESWEEWLRGDVEQALRIVADHREPALAFEIVEEKLVPGG